MNSRNCPCCRWNILLPDATAGAIAACPECGQCLRLPPPWKDGAIPNGDTRRLAVPAGFANEARPILDGLPQVHLGLGVVACVLATVQAAALVAALTGRFDLVLWRLGLFALAVLGAVTLIRAGRRNQQRRARARLVSLPSPISEEVQRLGTPFTHHDRGWFARLATLTLAAILGSLVAAAWSQIARDAADGRAVYLAAVFGPPAAVWFLWLGIRGWGVRVLVFPEGLLVWNNGPPQVWRWDEIEAITVQPGLLGRGYVLRRRGGAELAFGPDFEYVANQLGVRAQVELGRRLPDRLWESLNAGQVLPFGPLSLSKEGVHKGRHVLAWGSVAGYRLDRDNLTILRAGGWDHWSLEIGEVPNAMVFLQLLDRGQAELATTLPAPVVVESGPAVIHSTTSNPTGDLSLGSPL